MLIIISLISLLIALPGFINKGGYSLWKGFIPIYNLYLFFRIIEFSPIILMLFGIGLIISPDRLFILILLCCLMPFFVCDIFDKNKLIAVVTLLLPFIMYPLIAYFTGFYNYDSYEDDSSYFDKHKITTVLVICFSFFIYYNFYIITDVNKKVDSNSELYVNDIYMSDRYAYDKLGDEEKKMYDMLFDNIINYKKKDDFQLDDYSCLDYSECNNMLINSSKALFSDHPEIYYYGGLKWSLINNQFNIEFNYSELEELYTYIGEKRIKIFINRIKNSTKKKDDLDKIIYVYDWIGNKILYDNNFSLDSDKQSIYEFFINENANSVAFAKACQIIFQNIGIDSFMVTGSVHNKEHVWNIVKCNDKWYHFDSTISTVKSNDRTYHYKGLKANLYKGYELDNILWYPEIEVEEDLY